MGHTLLRGQNAVRENCGTLSQFSRLTCYPCRPPTSVYDRTCDPHSHVEGAVRVFAAKYTMTKRCIQPWSIFLVFVFTLRISAHSCTMHSKDSSGIGVQSRTPLRKAMGAPRPMPVRPCQARRAVPMWHFTPA